MDNPIYLKPVLSHSNKQQLIWFKDYANDFVSRIFSSMPSAQFGIVDFSDKVNAFGPINDRTAITNYINQTDPARLRFVIEASPK